MVEFGLGTQPADFTGDWESHAAAAMWTADQL
jgi:hypothetical protein